MNLLFQKKISASNYKQLWLKYLDQPIILTKRNSQNLLSAFLFKFSLDIASTYILPFIYAPFTLQSNLNLLKVAESYLLLLLVVFLLPLKEERNSAFITDMFIVILYVPTLVVYGISDESRFWAYANTIFWVSTLLLLKISHYSTAYKKIKLRIQNGKFLKNTLFWCIMFYALSSLFLSKNFSFALNFVEIYKVRANFSSYLPFATYIIYWSGLVVNPFLINASLLRKKLILSIFAISYHILLYATTGQKLFLLVMFASCALPLVGHQRRFSFFSTLCLVFSTLVFAGILSFQFYGEVWSLGIIANRLFILPAVISFNYFEFFSDKPLVLMAHGLFREIFNYPYDSLPWFLIGEKYFGYSHVSANTGMLADSYMNFGIYGLILLSCMFSAALVLVDVLSAGKNPKICLAIVVFPFLWSLNGSFLTSIMSGGLILAIFALLLLPSKMDSCC